MCLSHSPNDGPETEPEPPPPTTRERLLQAAIDLIAERGWGGVTTRMVADRAGVNQALVHYHYQTVPGLLREAAYSAMSAVFGPSMVRLPMVRLLGTEDPLDGLRGAMEAVSEIDPNAPEARVVIEATVQMARDPELNSKMKEMLPMFRSLLNDRLEAAQDRGGLVPRVQPAGLAVALAAMLDGLALHRMIDPQTDVRAATSAVLALLEARP